MNKTTLLRMVAAGLLVGTIIAVLVFLPVREYLGRFLLWVQAMGVWGPVFVAGLYVVACVFFVPGSILTLGAGFLFGIGWGYVAVTVGSVVGAAAAFRVGRTLLRGWVEARVSGYPRFAAIDRAIGKQGFKIVLLLRLSPIVPFNLLNYACGLTKVSLRDYVLASWIGMVPGTLMFVYFGSALKSLADVLAGKAQGGTVQTAFFIAGLVMTVVATVVITRIAKRALDEAIEEQGHGGDEEGHG
jgi:uncharacterized membrane protein YdjX (TVP38/TMEM64 family)